MKKRVLTAAIAAMCFVGTAPVSAVPITGVAENLQEQTVLTENDDAVTTTIAVTGTQPVTTITMPVFDDPTMQTSVVTVTIMDINGDIVLVKPVDGSPELKSSSKFSLSAKQLPADINPKVGMKLEITYNGGILETYPAMFGNVQKVVEVKEDTVKEDPTLLKGTKDMTLKDVMRLAKLGDELDWADFKDYNGRDVGSGLHIWEYKLEDGYVLDVGGDVMKKPLYILLSHDNDKGIDIRTEDVKEYIASTAAPVSENSENSKLKATAESVSKFMSENGISGYAYVGKADGVEKIYIPYAGDLEKLKTYVAEKGIDESLVVYQLSDWNNYGSGQSSGNKEVQKPLISEDDILDLSKKGDELTWSDFEKYEFTDIGDGTNIWQFVIKNSGSKLLVIGRDLKEKPEHINCVWGNGAEFDIRTEDLTPWFYDDALVVKGDANCDGQVDLSDAVMIMQALANPNKYGLDGTAEHHLTEQGKLNADMDGDGLTVGDAQAIQRKLLGLPSNIEVHSTADYPCAIKINGTVFWQTDEGFCEDFSNYTINKVTAYSENGTPQNDGESNFDCKCNTEFIILDEKTIVVKLQEGKVGFWIFRAKDDKTSVLPKIKLYHSVSTTDAQYTEMKVNEVVSIETNYDPLMSDWSGIGILLEFESKDYPITLSTNEGHFTTWDKEEGSGIVTNVGKTYDIGNSGYIFWTPDNLHYDEGFESEIFITGESNGKSIEIGKIVINMNDKHTLSAVFKW